MEIGKYGNVLFGKFFMYRQVIVDRPTRDILTIRNTTKSEWSDMPVNISHAG